MDRTFPGRAAIAGLTLVSLLSVSLLSIGGLGAQTPTPPVPRREVRLGVTALPAALDPALAAEGSLPLVARAVYDTLVAYRDGSTDIEPALATRWTVSPDGLVWSFVLRPGVQFHDGLPLTAVEVAASFNRRLDAKGAPLPPTPAWAGLLRGLPGVIREVRAASAATVQFVLSQPYAPLLTVLAHPTFGIVEVASAADATGHLAGSGPYRVAEMGSDHIVLDAVPGHWSGPARSARLVFLPVASEDEAEQQLAARELDVWFPSAPPRRTEGVLSAPGLRVGYLAFQTEKQPFSHKKLRQAVAGALDPALLAVALGRSAVPLPSFLPPGVWGRREGLPVLGASRHTVAGLLREGGWSAARHPTLLVPAEPTPIDLPKLAETVQAMLQAVGIAVTLRVEPSEVVSTARERGDHDLLLAEASVSGGDPHLLLYPLSTSEGASRGPQNRNFSFYRNPRLDDILTRAGQLGYRPERIRLYHRAQAMLAAEIPWLPLYVQLQWAVVRPEVRGLRLHPTGFHRLTTVGLEGG